MEEQPHAVWLTKGTPKEVRYKVEQVVLKARAKSQVPILVAYNIPGRDCAGALCGGALTTPEYRAWIDAFASGIGSSGCWSSSSRTGSACCRRIAAV